MRTPEATVFVVDDDEGALEATQSLLESLGYYVETYSSAKEFLGGYDPMRRGCLLVDLAMPEMTGLDLLRASALRGWRLPTILLTGSTEDDPRIRGMTDELFGFVEKCGDPGTLIDLVARALECAVDDRGAQPN